MWQTHVCHIIKTPLSLLKLTKYRLWYFLALPRPPLGMQDFPANKPYTISILAASIN